MAKGKTVSYDFVYLIYGMYYESSYSETLEFLKNPPIDPDYKLDDCKDLSQVWPCCVPKGKNIKYRMYYSGDIDDPFFFLGADLSEYSIQELQKVDLEQIEKEILEECERVNLPKIKIKTYYVSEKNL